MSENKTHFQISVKNIKSGRGEDFETVSMTESQINTLLSHCRDKLYDSISFRSREKGIIGSGIDQYFHKQVVLLKKNFDIFTVEVAPIIKERKGKKHHAENL